LIGPLRVGRNEYRQKKAGYLFTTVKVDWRLRSSWLSQNSSLLAGTAALLISLAAFGAGFRTVYVENQNTKFLHAFAQSGIGFLREDWTAQTKDGLPLFTAIVKLILNSVGEPGFYFAAFLTYFAFGICAALLHLQLTRNRPLPRWNMFIFAALVCVTAAVPALKWNAFNGLGNQYLLNGYFQTSDFGILLIVSILAFVVGRVVIATVSAAIAAALHPGYVAPAAVLLLIYVTFEVGAAQKTQGFNWWINIATLALGVASLLAIALLIQGMFPPSSVADYQEAHRLLVEFRIPKHANPWNWNVYDLCVKAMICYVAIAMLPNGRLRFVVTAASLATLVFLLVGLLPNLSTYKLVAPWRLSVALIPLATLICLSVAATRATIFLEELSAKQFRLVSLIGTAIVATILIAGGINTARSLGRPFPVYRDFVRSHLEAGQLYLTDPSANGFRLLTGAPQYVSAKTHPYQDREVLEWYRRLRLAKAFFRSRTVDCEDLKRFAITERVTHLLAMPKYIDLSCSFAREVFKKSGFVILELDARAD
jgi:hypothetical protein